jgi:hypothetical protein
MPCPNAVSECRVRMLFHEPHRTRQCRVPTDIILVGTRHCRVRMPCPNAVSECRVRMPCPNAISRTTSDTAMPCPYGHHTCRDTALPCPNAVSECRVRMPCPNAVSECRVRMLFHFLAKNHLIQNHTKPHLHVLLLIILSNLLILNLQSC